TAYPIHPDNPDLVSSVIVNIDPPNKEPIRTLTLEAPLVNEPDPVNKAFSPLSLFI
ncbi:22733_t:CDS:1, partial [Gigaspora margarita]